MRNCKKSRFMCHFPEKDCDTCNIKEIENLNQLIPSPRTVDDVIKILSQYPKDTKFLGITDEHIITNLSTIQANCPDGKINNVMILYWEKKETDNEQNSND